MTDASPNEPFRTQLEMTRLNLNHTLEKLYNKTQEYDTALTNLREQEGKHQRTKEELNTLNEKYVRLEERYVGLEEKLKQAQENLSQKAKKVAKRKASIILQTVLIDILFLLSTILASFGVNILTSTRPGPAGWTSIGLAIATYFVAACIGILRTPEGIE